MYDPNCLEWHLDDGNEVRPPQVSVWSCKVAGEAFALISNRLAAALPRAKTTEHLAGGFCFCRPYSARSRGRKWGCSEGNRDTVCRKARGQFPNNPCGWSNHQAEGRTVRTRSMMIPQGGGTCSFLLHWCGVGGSLGGIY
jgi:hypothetical protein